MASSRVFRFSSLRGNVGKSSSLRGNVGSRVRFIANKVDGDQNEETGETGESKTGLIKWLALPSAGLIIKGMDKVMEYATYGCKVPKPKMNQPTHDEINLEIPVPALDKKEIKTSVDENNVFIVEAENTEREYFQTVKLPMGGNFEKAEYSHVKLDRGMLFVTIKNFNKETLNAKLNKETVIVKFTD